MSRYRSSLTVLVLTALAAACQATPVHDGGLADPDGAARADVGAPTDSNPAADTTVSTDGGTSDAHDGGVDGAPPPSYGDRNLGVVEPYPDSLLIQNGGRFYNLRNPPTPMQHAAVGDGVTDDTAAFQDAYDYLKARFLAATGVPATTHLNAPNSQAARDADSYWLYLPDGTYRVSDMLWYRGVGLQQYYATTYGTTYPFGTPWFDLIRIRLVGQSREHTIITLADHSAGFADAAHPRPVVTFQHPTTTFNDWNAENLLKNLTIDTGHGNPGAVGILAQGANSSGVRNVLVRSGDGAGVYGIWLPIGPVQGCYHDLTVTGFDYAIAQTQGSGTNGCFENVTIRNQHRAGVLVTQANFVVRNLLADETATAVPAVLMNDRGAQLLVIDSSLAGAGDASIVVPSDTNDSLFVRNVTSSGFTSTVSYGGRVVAAGPHVDEYTSGAVTLFDGGVATSLNLPIPQVPLAAWYDPATQWANVESYRTAGMTDTAAAQAALDSGKPVVVFPRAVYSTMTLTVPASVKRVDLLSSNFDSGGELDVTEASSDPIVFENGSGVTFRIVSLAQRDVVIRQGANLTENPHNLPVRLFVENGGAGYDANFAPSNGSIWARGLDIEYRDISDFTATGGTLWIMGYKTEGTASILSATNGSHVEVLSGYSYMNATTTHPMVVNVDSTVSFVATQTANRVQFDPVVSETQRGVTHTASPSMFPGYVGRGTNDFVVPLYVGRAH